MPVTSLNPEMLSWFPVSGWEVLFADLALFTFLISTLGSSLCVRTLVCPTGLCVLLLGGAMLY